MAPVTSILLAGLSLFSETLAVKLFATHFSGQVYSLDLSFSDPTKGTLKVDQKATGCGVTPTWLYLDEAKRTLYCFDESWATGGGVITQWSVPKADSGKASTLSISGSAKTAGNSVHGSLYGGADGRGFVVTSEYSPSTITTYKLPITSNTKPIQTLTWTMAKPGPRPDRQDKPHPHSAFLDPTGAFMIVPDLGADLTRIFQVNNETGMLKECADIPSNPGDGPRHGLFRKAGDALKYYSLNEVSSSVGVYDVSTKADCLSLTLTQTLGTYGPNVPIGNATVKSAEIRIVGDYLYASNRNDSTFGKELDSIALYKIGADGKLAFVGLQNSYGYYPRSFSFNEAGTYVAIAGQTTANIAILAVDGATGKLGPLVANLNLPPKGTYGGEDGLSSVIWDEYSTY